jgi:hypothetical protein
MDMVGRIRRLHSRKNKSERKIARNTVAKWLHGQVGRPAEVKFQVQIASTRHADSAVRSAVEDGIGRSLQVRPTSRSCFQKSTLGALDAR